MKELVPACILVLTAATFAFAGWVEDFQGEYQRSGIDPAVVAALKAGIQPADIIVEGLKIEGLNPVNLIQALYCAGVPGDDIGPAALEAGISQLVLSAGYEQSVARCGSAVTDTQAYTPVTPTGGPDFPAGAGDGGTVYVSASTL